MKRISLLALVIVGVGVYVACGDDGLGNGADLGNDLSASTDLSHPTGDMAHPGGGVDLAGRDFAGVNCGTEICTASQECCVFVSGGSFTASCVAAGTGCGDGGIAATCDGPEDCSGGTPNCCANISLDNMSVMGQATCTATCPGNAQQGTNGGMVTSKLCHNSADCVGYTGMAPVLGNTNFDSCCGTANISVRFCAPSLITAVNNMIMCD
jgi:hypothetical protein